jgi:Cellobiose phosphorylase
MMRIRVSPRSRRVSSKGWRCRDPLCCLCRAGCRCRGTRGDAGQSRRRTREFELTSYAEVCLNDRKADQAHPAFAKLFLETEFDPRCGALLARRRPRSPKEQPVWAIHASAASVSANEIEYETDRMRFLGRGRTPANPAALDSGSRLSRTTGPVLDPIFSLRRRVSVEAGMATASHL